MITCGSARLSPSQNRRNPNCMANNKSENEMRVECAFWVPSQVQKAPSPRRLLFLHLDSLLDQLHRHPASENGECFKEYVFLCLCFGHVTPKKKNGVEILRLLFSISFVFALFCRSCGCRSLPVSSKSGNGNKQGYLSVLFYLLLLSALQCPVRF